MRYISVLRGINVGGHKKIKMADLKALYIGLEFTNVITYIQSGNVIFESSETNVSLLIDKIEGGILKQYGFEVPVLIRTTEVWHNIIQNHPFDVDALENLTTISVTLLSSAPSETSFTTLMSYVKAPDLLTLDDKTIYLYTPNGYGKTKITTNFIEKKLEVKATTRNWKSVMKLHELSKDEKGI